MPIPPQNVAGRGSGTSRTSTGTIGSDRDQPPGRVTASFLSVHERPFHERRAQRVGSRLFGRELAFELVDEVIDRPAIEPLPAFASLVEVENRQPRSLEKRAAPRGERR